MSPPTEQTGYRIHHWGDQPAWDSFPTREPGPEEALIEVEACGIGGTVLNCIAGQLADERATLPRVPGHEVVGRVVGVGANVSSEIVGRRIVAYFYLICGRCAACVSDMEARCMDLAGWVGVHVDGGYAPWMVLPSRNVIVVPAEVDPVEATVAADAVATPVHVAERAAIGPDDRVAVIGAGGGVGAHMVQVAAQHGAAVAGLDITDEKLALIERLGALPVPSPDFSHLDGGLFDGAAPTVVVDFIGTTMSGSWALASLATGGRLVAMTTFPERPVPLEPRDLVMRELSVIGSRYATRSQVAEAVRLVADGAVEPIIGAITDPSGVPELHEKLRAGRVLGRGALDWSR